MNKYIPNYIYMNTQNTHLSLDSQFWNKNWSFSIAKANL